MRKMCLSSCVMTSIMLANQADKNVSAIFETLVLYIKRMKRGQGFFSLVMISVVLTPMGAHGAAVRCVKEPPNKFFFSQAGIAGHGATECGYCQGSARAVQTQRRRGHS